LDSDLAQLIRSVQCGVAIPSGRIQMLSDTILDAYRNQGVWLEMGKRGFDHVIQNYSRSVITARYHDLIKASTKKFHVLCYS